MIKEYFKYETTDYKNIEALGIVLAGQTVIRAKTGDDFIFPEVIRFHASNVADGFAFGFIANNLSQVAKSAFNIASKSSHLSAAILMGLVGLSVETYNAMEPNRTFDHIDMALHCLLSIHKQSVQKRKP
jgi:hypothetical protein